MLWYFFFQNLKKYQHYYIAEIKIRNEKNKKKEIFKYIYEKKMFTELYIDIVFSKSEKIYGQKKNMKVIFPKFCSYFQNTLEIWDKWTLKVFNFFIYPLIFPSGPIDFFL